MLDAFKAETNGKMLCSDICGHRFSDLFEHTQYLNEGGCSRIMGILAEAADA
jgi:hypothetical protein